MDHHGQLASLRSNSTCTVNKKCWFVDCIENVLPHCTREVGQMPWSNYHYGIQQSYLDASPKVWFGLPKESFGAGPFLLLLFLDHSWSSLFVLTKTLRKSNVSNPVSLLANEMDKIDIHFADYIWLFLDILSTQSRLLYLSQTSIVFVSVYLFCCIYNMYSGSHTDKTAGVSQRAVKSVRVQWR